MSPDAAHSRVQALHKVLRFLAGFFRRIFPAVFSSNQNPAGMPFFDVLLSVTDGDLCWAASASRALNGGHEFHPLLVVSGSPPFSSRCLTTLSPIHRSH